MKAIAVFIKALLVSGAGLAIVAAAISLVLTALAMTDLAPGVKPMSFFAALQFILGNITTAILSVLWQAMSSLRLY
ncbi:hypothetical protein GCM10012275_07660 [Longimycelium tulufanense]|uniref:Uncharacterized protein n=1 Tax=Longimycelium tulufanense TaxID=907463 RepID=A0A8J3C9G5_9PSEU|nr:hypothetical protein [Longimycelium tulufanense]GGM39226.1 hypothetical protein GCM10012275_07660 [Longimycelium tulufanense]